MSINYNTVNVYVNCSDSRLLTARAGKLLPHLVARQLKVGQARPQAATLTQKTPQKDTKRTPKKLQNWSPHYPMYTSKGMCLWHVPRIVGNPKNTIFWTYFWSVRGSFVCTGAMKNNKRHKANLSKSTQFWEQAPGKAGNTQKTKKRALITRRTIRGEREPPGSLLGASWESLELLATQNAAKRAPGSAIWCIKKNKYKDIF